MFVGAHVILYSGDAEADRGFIAEVLGFPHVDTGGGWLIFRLQLAAAGVEVSREISEERWGRLASIPLPSGARLPVYQPLHPVAYNLQE